MIVVEETFPEADEINEKRSLVGEHADEAIGKETIRMTMGKIWKFSKSKIFKENHLYCYFCNGC